MKSENGATYRAPVAANKFTRDRTASIQLHLVPKVEKKIT